MNFVKVSTTDMVKVLEHEMKSVIKLISLVHDEASRAYWATRHHCGSDWSESCEPCFAYEECKSNEQIEKILKEIDSRR